MVSCSLVDVRHRAISSGGEFTLLFALEKQKNRKINREAGFREKGKSLTVDHLGLEQITCRNLRIIQVRGKKKES